MNFVVLFRESAAEFLNLLPEKSQRIVIEKLSTLKTDPWPGKTGDKKKLKIDKISVFRMHIGRSYTAIYLIHTENDRNIVEITHLMTAEQAHKKYGRL